MRIVPLLRTPLNALQVAASLREAWPGITRQMATLFHALVWEETGRGLSCNNFNPGNITAGAAYAGDAFRPSWFDSPGPLHDAMLKGQAPSAFRAYNSLSQGFADFRAELERDFPEVLAASHSGDADAFTTALSRKYSHDYASPAAHRNMAGLAHELAALYPDLPDDPLGPAPASEEPPAPCSSSEPPGSSSEADSDG